MQNAHERFGSLEFIKRTKDATTRVRVHIDRAVLETPKDERGQARAHLLSMIGGDSEIGALWAAVTKELCSKFNYPTRTSIAVLLGPNAMLSRECDGSGEGAWCGTVLAVQSLAKTSLVPTVKAHEPFCAMTIQYLSFIVLCIDMAFQ